MALAGGGITTSTDEVPAFSTILSPTIGGFTFVQPRTPLVTSMAAARKDEEMPSPVLTEAMIKLLRVHMLGVDNTSPVLDTPKPLMFGGIADMPTTAELMQRCLAVNPFEAKFREANQKISNGVPPTSVAGSSLEAMEVNGLVPAPGSMPSTANLELLLKNPGNMQQSPIWPISILQSSNNGNGELSTETLRTADISKFLAAFQAGDSSAAPRTADILNQVLDMHSDRLGQINYINKPDFSAFLRSPRQSAPNSGSILQNSTICAPSTSGNQLQTSTANGHSPKGANESKKPEYRSQASAVAQQALMNNPLLGFTGTIRTAAAPPQTTVSDPMWDPRDIKPKDLYPNQYNGGDDIMSLDDHKNGSSGSEREMTPINGHLHGSTPGRGRGRGRTTTAEMPPDERRLTILERNKAAAVRYRKRKKEEHDDMIGRVHGLEQEKNALATQNQVLRAELERVTALLHERDARCVCLKGLNNVNDLRTESPVDILSSPNRGGMYDASQQLMLSGLGLPNGLQQQQLKIPKMP